MPLKHPHHEVHQPAHYTAGDVECIDGIRSALGPGGFEAYCAGNVLKYVWRYHGKGGVVDLHKARTYLEWAIEAAEAGKAARALHGGGDASLEGLDPDMKGRVLDAQRHQREEERGRT